MAQSMHTALDSNIEDYSDRTSFRPPALPRSQTYLEYSVIRNEDAVIHRETLRQKDSHKAVYELDVPMHYAVGSGRRGRSYITASDGIMRMSPITWYTSGHKWDLSPGYERTNLQFNRRIVDGCLQCHAGRVNTESYSTHHFAEEPFSELCIGCERCHGPGEDHISYHSGLDETIRADSIVNPAKLPGDLSDHVCFQCHLIGEERITQFGRSDFDFRPGDRISDIWAVFVKGDSVDSENATEAVSQVGQMLSSRCYIESEGKFGCTSCHDPHSVPNASDRDSFYRSRCMTCHQPEESPCTERPQSRRNKQDSCVACHMPKLPASDVPHISLTDHRVRRRPERQDVSRHRQSTEQVFDSRNHLDARTTARAKAIRMVTTANDAGASVVAVQAIPVLEDWIVSAPDDVVALDALGAAYQLAGDGRRASEVWQKGLSLDPRNERFLRQLFFHNHDNGQLAEAASLGKRLIEVNPWDFEYHGRMAHVLGQLGQLDAAIKHANRALEINPSAYQLHGWLAEILQRVGRPELARKQAQLYKLTAPSP